MVKNNLIKKQKKLNQDGGFLKLLQNMWNNDTDEENYDIENKTLDEIEKEIQKLQKDIDKNNVLIEDYENKLKEEQAMKIISPINIEQVGGNKKKIKKITSKRRKRKNTRKMKGSSRCIKKTNNKNKRSLRINKRFRKRRK